MDGSPSATRQVHLNLTVGDVACVYCGAEAHAQHHLLCPFPIVNADPNRAGLRDIAMSDYVDQVYPAIWKVPESQVRQVLIDMAGLVLNWGIRTGFASAETVGLNLAPTPADRAELAERFAEHRPR